MLPIVVPSLIELGTTLLDKIFPDPEKANEAKLKLLELQQSGQLAELNAQVAMAAGQTDTNKVEAASNRLFVAGWRPFVGWICGAALGFKFIGGPLLVVLGSSLGYHPVLPDIDFSDLITLLLGMLGLGGLRTVEKIKGVA